jgi:uncharacterized protein (DUF433 family)
MLPDEPPMEAAEHASTARRNPLLHLPAYSFTDAARLAQASPQNVRRWFRGYHAPSHHMDHVLPSGGRAVLSYLQLVDVTFVASFQRLGVDLDRLRSAHRYLRVTFGVEYPFARWRFATDGVHVLAAHGESIIGADRGGRLALRRVIQERAEQFDYEDGVALRWHPRGRGSVIVVDPRIAFGAPSVAGVPTRVLRDRYLAGEDVGALAEDFDVAPAQLDEALDFEEVARRAA